MKKAYFILLLAFSCWREDKEIISSRVIPHNQEDKIIFVGDKVDALLGEESTLSIEMEDGEKLREVISESGNTIELTGGNSFKYSANKPNVVLDTVVAKVEGGDGRIRNMMANLSVATRATISYIIYLAGDNDLGTDGFLHRDLKEIENSYIDTSKINIIIYLDVPKREHFLKDKEYRPPGIYKLIDGKIRRVKDILEEKDTGNKETMVECLKEALSFSKSETHILDIWGHGLGVMGVGFDDYVGKSQAEVEDSSLTPNELRDALKEGLGGKKLEVLMFSACLMVNCGALYPLIEYAKTVVGSPEVVPADGSFYGGKNGILGWLSRNNQLEAKDLAKNIARINYESFLHGGDQHNARDHYHKYLCYTAIDMSIMSKVTEKARSAFTSLYIDPNFYFGNPYPNPNEENPFTGVENECLSYNNNDHDYRRNAEFLDLVDFLNVSKRIFPQLSTETKTNVDNLLESLEKLMIFSKSIDEKYNGSNKSGISILYPREYFHTRESLRKASEFIDKSGWGDLVKESTWENENWADW